MANPKIFDGTTHRLMTDAEYAQWQTDASDAQAQAEAAETRAEARQAVLDKLGLTADEAAALLGQFGNTGDLDRLRNNTRQHTYRQSARQKHDTR